MTSFSSTDPLPNAEIVRNFLDWVRDLMRKCGGKDVYFNDGTVVKGAFEGFLGAGLAICANQCCAIFKICIFYKTVKSITIVILGL